MFVLNTMIVNIFKLPNICAWPYPMKTMLTKITALVHISNIFYWFSQRVVKILWTEPAFRILLLFYYYWQNNKEFCAFKNEQRFSKYTFCLQIFNNFNQRQQIKRKSVIPTLMKDESYIHK